MHEERLTKFWQVLTGICVAMWLVVAAGTIKKSVKGTMFFAPCLGTDLFLKRIQARNPPDTEKGHES
jgi:hypothetical protein